MTQLASKTYARARRYIFQKELYHDATLVYVWFLISNPSSSVPNPKAELYFILAHSGMGAKLP